ncbi:MAG TPA: mandelate racemase/muconate lactonizing enzyme family protein [Terriglobales bacterium]|nr:mandelate racemase/muconate lactonizing enzyme family protein [Terriglobales bacterium]
MRIAQIIEKTIPIHSEMANAVISFKEMTVSAIAIITDITRDGRRVTGYGFSSNGRYGQSGILQSRIIPRLLAASEQELLNDAGNNFDPERCWRVMMRNEKPGGHGERSVAVGAVDMALWDVIAKIESKPLFRILADRYCGGKTDPDVWVYAAGGYYYGTPGLAALKDEMKSYLDLGYDTVKMKIGGASLSQDISRIEAVLSILGRGQTLAVDANARFETKTAVEYGHALEGYGLQWYEEPGDPLDFELLKYVAHSCRVPLATGENLFSLADVRNLIRYGGLNSKTSILQIDPALSYGLVEYLRILNMLAKSGWSSRRCVPHGGHQLTLHIAAGLGLGGNESYPGLFQPFGGFADGERVQHGRLRLPEEPGIGIELKSELHKIFQQMTS